MAVLRAGCGKVDGLQRRGLLVGVGPVVTLVGLGLTIGRDNCGRIEDIFKPG